MASAMDNYQESERDPMKRMISLLLALLTTCFLFSGCQSNPEESSSSATPPPDQSETTENPLAQLPQVRLCIDLGTSVTGTFISQILDMIPGNMREYMLVTETVPIEQPERENTLTRLHTEILAGKGPDLFLCGGDCTFWANLNTRALFPFPEKAMQSRLFLPLDDYIANAEYTDWDQLQPAVMEAGCTDEGQQIIPLLYEVRMLAFPNSQYEQEEFQRPMTWQDMQESSNDRIRFTASCASLADTFGKLADFKKDQPTFTEEELLKRVQESEALRQETNQGGFPTFSRPNPDFPKYPYIWNDGISAPRPFGFGVEDDFVNEEFHFVPVYNQDGGVTATIRVYGGINRNSQYPDVAFRFFDYIMQEKLQRSYSIPLSYSNGCPIQIGIGTESLPAQGQRMNDWNFDQYQAVIEEINAVNYESELNYELYKILWDIIDEEKSAADAVHSAYMKMCMLVGES